MPNKQIHKFFYWLTSNSPIIGYPQSVLQVLDKALSTLTDLEIIA